MKKLLLLIIMLPFAAVSQAQNDRQIEAMMTRRALRCDDVWYNAYYLIPELYLKNEHDTLDAMLKYIEQHCGTNDELTNFNIIKQIKQGTFSEDLYKGHYIAGMLERYQKAINYIKTKKPDNSTAPPYVYRPAHLSQARDTFYLFLQQTAKALAEKTSNSALEQWLIHYYADPTDSLLKSLKDNTFSNTLIQKDYIRLNYQPNERPGMIYSVSAGAWIPNGDMSLLGTHPYINLHIGGRGRKFMAGVTVGAKFIKSPNPYSVWRKDSLYNSNSFTGYYFGFDMGYSLMETNRSEFDVTAGLGYDGLTTLSIEKDDDTKDISQTIHSLNLNAGLGYKYWFKGGGFIGIETKYNFLFYNNKGGTSLSGNAITLGLTLGFVNRGVHRNDHSYYRNSYY